MTSDLQKAAYPWASYNLYFGQIYFRDILDQIKITPQSVVCYTCTYTISKIECRIFMTLNITKIRKDACKIRTNLSNWGPVKASASWASFNTILKLKNAPNDLIKTLGSDGIFFLSESKKILYFYQNKLLKNNLVA